MKGRLMLAEQRGAKAGSERHFTGMLLLAATLAVYRIASDSSGCGKQRPQGGHGKPDWLLLEYALAA